MLDGAMMNSIIFFIILNLWYLVAVCVALVDERVVELDEHLLDVEPDQRVVAVLHRDLAGQPQQALEV